MGQRRQYPRDADEPRPGRAQLAGGSRHPTHPRPANRRQRHSDGDEKCKRLHGGPPSRPLGDEGQNGTQWKTGRLDVAVLCEGSRGGPVHCHTPAFRGRATACKHQFHTRNSIATCAAHHHGKSPWSQQERRRGNSRRCGADSRGANPRGEDDQRSSHVAPEGDAGNQARRRSCRSAEAQARPRATSPRPL